MSEQLPEVPEAPDLPGQLPVEEVPPVPVSAPDLAPYATWRQDQEKGARAAHDDARLDPEDRWSPEAVAAEGYAFWAGYTDHWTALRNAGVIA